MPSKISQSEFLRRCYDHWSYDFSESEYLGSKVKVKVRCRDHGEFYQSPDCLFRGIGCPKCGYQERTVQNKADPLITLKRCRSILPHLDFSEAVYRNLDTPINLNCPKHGQVSLVPRYIIDHQSDCTMCKPRLRSKEQFSQLCYVLDYPNLDYSKTMFSGVDQKVTITCLDHGDYTQFPRNHLKSRGCNRCRYEQTAVSISHTAYLKRRRKGGYYFYAAEVDLITKRSYEKHLEIINPERLPRGLGLYHVDHVYSKFQGFLDGVDPTVIGHYSNLRMLCRSDNCQKQARCDKTLEELYRDFRQASDGDQPG